MTTTPTPAVTAPAARLRGNTAIVTGAPRNIGASAAAALAAEGADVVVHYFNRRAEAEGTVAELRSAGGSAIAVGGDLVEVLRSRGGRVIEMRTPRSGRIWAGLGARSREERVLHNPYRREPS